MSTLCTASKAGIEAFARCLYNNDSASSLFNCSYLAVFVLCISFNIFFQNNAEAKDQPSKALPTFPIEIANQSYKWTLGFEAGCSVDILMPTPRSIFAINGSRRWGQYIETQLAMRFQLADDNWGIFHLDMLGGAFFRYERWIFTLLAGPRVGYSAMKIDVTSEYGFWTGALLINLAAELRIQLRRALELRFSLLSASYYWNEVGVLCWEPLVGIGYRF